jgi:integrase
VQVFKPTFNDKLTNADMTKLFTVVDEDRNARQKPKDVKAIAKLLAAEIKECSHWYITFVDNQQVRRRLPAFTDKRATERAAVNLDKLLSSGGILTQELQHWLEKEIPVPMRERLVDWRIIDSQRMSSHLGKSLAEHVEDFRLTLQNRGCAPHYVKRTAADLCRMFAACGFGTWADIDGGRLYNYLGGLRQGADGIAQRTFNASLQAAKGFCKWMLQEQRAPSNPLQYLQYTKQTENRRRRRALDVDEQRRLLTATAAGPKHHALTGPERTMIYRVALETGLRANEIRHLTPASFDFEACRVYLPGTYTKNGKAADLPLKPDTAAALRAFLADKAPDARPFAVPSQPARMMRLDLKAAGIEYVVNGEQADFHSLRHTFITNVGRTGAPVFDVMKLARHSDVKMTLGYTHGVQDAEENAINALPDLTAAPKSLTPACLGQRSA